MAFPAFLIPAAARAVVALVEKIKGKGHGADEKKPLATEILQLVFGAVQKRTPGVGLPQDAAEVDGLVQTAWAELNSAGQLKGHATRLASLDDATLELCASALECQAARLRTLKGD